MCESVTERIRRERGKSMCARERKRGEWVCEMILCVKERGVCE